MCNTITKKQQCKPRLKEIKQIQEHCGDKFFQNTKFCVFARPSLVSKILSFACKAGKYFFGINVVNTQFAEVGGPSVFSKFVVYFSNID